MQKSEIESKVKSIVAEQLDKKIEEVTNEKTFADLGADSLSLVELVMAFEDEFKIEISDESSAKILTVQQAIDEVSSAL